MRECGVVSLPPCPHSHTAVWPRVPAPDIFMTCASSRHEYSAEDRGREAGVRSVSIIMDGDNGEFFDLDIDNHNNISTARHGISIF